MHSDMSKEEILDKYRYFNVEHDWWEWTYEDFSNQLELVGINVEDINFSGFHSQGDGASFTGNVNRDEMVKFMRAHDLIKNYPAAYYFAELKELGIKWVRSTSHYSHEYTVNVNIDDDYILYEEDYAEGDFRREIYKVMTVEFLKEFEQFEATITEIGQKHMRKLYADLQEEFNYLTSDRIVMESMEANGIFDQLKEEN